MISSFKGISYKFLCGNKRMVLSSIITILISTILIIGMFNFADESLRHFSEDIVKKYEIQSTSQSLRKSIEEKIKNIDDDLKVGLLEDYKEFKKEKISIDGFISFFSFLILLISSLFINSNMQSILYEYKEQFSVLRSLGASGRDIFKVLFIQSTIINLTGISIAFTISWMAKITNMYLVTIVITIFVVLEILTILSPIKGLKIMPINSFRDNELSQFKLSKSRRNIGALMGGASIISIILNVSLKHNMNSFIYTVISSITLIIAFLMILPFVLEKFMSKVLSSISKLISSSRRNYLSILIITVTTIIVVFGSSFFQIINKNSISYLKKLYPKDITVQTSLLNEGMGEEVYKKIKSIDGISYTAEYIDYVPMVKDREVLDFQISFNSDIEEGKVILLKEIAQKYGINKGDKLSIRRSSYEDKINTYNRESFEINFNEEVGKVTVEKVIDRLDEKSFYYNGVMNIKLLEKLNKFNDPTNIYIETDNLGEVKLKLQELKNEYKYKEINYGTYKEALEKDKSDMDKRWKILRVSLFTMIIITILGVYNMIIDYLYSRKEEIEILRELGVTRIRISMNITYMLIVYFAIGILNGGILGIIISKVLSVVG